MVETNGRVWLPVLAGLAVALALLLAGAIAGFFYAYSSSVMRGLDAVPAAHAIVAMQGINAEVRNAVFAPVFFGTPVAAAVAGGLLLVLRLRTAGAAALLAAAVYVAGGILPTVAVNVPMNEALAGVAAPADAQAAARLWADYSARWTWWNHVRTVASLASLLLVGLAACLAGRYRFGFG